MWKKNKNNNNNNKKQTLYVISAKHPFKMWLSQKRQVTWFRETNYEVHLTTEA